MGENIQYVQKMQPISDLFPKYRNSSHSPTTKKPKKLNQKMDRRPRQIFFQIRYTNSQETHENMLNIANYQRKANQNYNEISPHTSLEWPSSKSLQTINAGEDMEKGGMLLHCLWECKLIQPLQKTIWRFLKRLEIKLPYDPAIPLLSIYPQETKIEKDICIPYAALFTIARTWKQPRYLSTDEWIKKLWYIYTMEYYSDIKKGTHLSQF